MTQCMVKGCTRHYNWHVTLGIEDEGVTADINLCNKHMDENATKDLVLDNGNTLEAKNKGWKCEFDSSK